MSTQLKPRCLVCRRALSEPTGAVALRNQSRICNTCPGCDGAGLVASRESPSVAENKKAAARCGFQQKEFRTACGVRCTARTRSVSLMAIRPGSFRSVGPAFAMAGTEAIHTRYADEGTVSTGCPPRFQSPMTVSTRIRGSTGLARWASKPAARRLARSSDRA